jgi:hypothetical protein
MRAPRFLTRRMLQPVRVLQISAVSAPDPMSPEYLYLVQQCKRLGLVQTLDSFKFDNVRQWPGLLAIAAFKWLDLSLSSTLIRSLINEHDLLLRCDDGERCKDPH